MITDIQQQLLKQYQDKAYINALLAEESTDYYNFIKTLSIFHLSFVILLWFV